MVVDILEFGSLRVFVITEMRNFVMTFTDSDRGQCVQCLFIGIYHSQPLLRNTFHKIYQRPFSYSTYIFQKNICM